jgi:hypothetical protein
VSRGTLVNYINAWTEPEHLGLVVVAYHLDVWIQLIIEVACNRTWIPITSWDRHRSCARIQCHAFLHIREQMHDHQ